MKKINKVLMIGCFTIVSAHAKQIGSKTTTNAPTSYIQPAPRPYAQPTPYVQPTSYAQPAPYYPQTQTGPTYSEILYSLQKKTPDSSDFSTLNNIIYTAQEQIKQIQASVEKKSSTQPKTTTNTNAPDYLLQMKASATKLVYQYQMPLDRTPEQIHETETRDVDLFSQWEQQQHGIAIFSIVRDFLGQYPNTNKETTINTIYLALEQHPGFAALQRKLSSRLQQEINKEMKELIGSAWDTAQQKK